MSDFILACCFVYIVIFNAFMLLFMISTVRNFNKAFGDNEHG